MCAHKPSHKPSHTLQVTRQLRMDGWPALSIHGDKSQQERDWVLSEFKQNKSPIMLATDVAARGLGRTELDCTYVKLACMCFVWYQLLYKVHCGKLAFAKVPTLTAVWQACLASMSCLLYAVHIICTNSTTMLSMWMLTVCRGLRRI